MGISSIRRAAPAALFATGLIVVAIATVTSGGTATAQTPPSVTDYIVTLDPGTENVASIAADQLGEVGSDLEVLDRVFSTAIEGYTAELTAAQASALAGLPGVRSVEEDGLAWLTETQPNPPWGIDRIDQNDLPLSASYTYTATGQGVTAYVIDSGVRASHVDFGGRATTGTDIVDGGPADDCLGHGTHVSSTVGGTTHGVAKRVLLVAVRVFGCQSTAPVSDVIAGVDWVTADHQPGEPAVANMSLSYTASPALDGAVQQLVDDGVTVAVAAGNGALGLFPLNACDWSPGRLPGAITVAASDINDGMANFSNRGSCVDLIGPGVDVPGAWYTADDATANASGTSMASPHVAGAAAQYLQTHQGATPAQVSDALKAGASTGTISGTGPCWLGFICVFSDTPNLLVRSS